MKVRKRIKIIADILIDEDFDTNFLCICEQEETGFGNPDLYLGRSENFEVINYISQETLNDEEIREIE